MINGQGKNLAASEKSIMEIIPDTNKILLKGSFIIVCQTYPGAYTGIDLGGLSSRYLKRNIMNHFSNGGFGRGGLNHNLCSTPRPYACLRKKITREFVNLYKRALQSPILATNNRVPSTTASTPAEPARTRSSSSSSWELEEY